MTDRPPPADVPRDAQSACQMILLDLCGGKLPKDDIFAELDDEAWELLETTAFQTRTAGLLHRHLVDGAIAVPADTAARLADHYRRQTLYALGQRIVLGQIAETFDGAGIPHVALKGAALAFSLYPQPAMRPLRDLDVLVPRARAEEAHLLLRRTGFTHADWAGQYGLDYNHQLPELVSAEHGVTVEIHHRVFARKWAGDAALTALLLDSAREMQTATGRVCVSAPLANLLHLTVQTTLHNCFESGPLFLADFHRLLAGNDFDWDDLFALADRLVLSRPLALLLAFVEAHGREPVVPDRYRARMLAAGQFLPDARHAMFRAETGAEARAMMRRMAEAGERYSNPVSALRRLLSPRAEQLGKIAGTDSADPRRWRAWPAWAWRRGATWMQGISGRDNRAALQHDRRLLDWLSGPTS